ncbi:helix-turn-helix domain-containing protein [Burkholderia ubonensis]|uniref:helix-turn-helix domain-containing protein n=1 Tax=Burkholderia ubonensis TaxID=101571 RepID=UPI000BA5387F|nr:helix-turn-helix transcriptional regulator [Burkholderia ubonensis]PAJ93681.1 XRE family transcriptional regulator [Burkholderia ubonensis]RQP68943.1 XRE family transcriptional regulator [Burkholderia ubonensis]
MRSRTVKEWEVELGESLRTLRLHRNLDQATLAARAGISVRSLRNLESGNGSSLHTLIEVVRTLGRESWLELIAPVPTVNPLMMARNATTRQRASKPRRKPPSNPT